MKNKKQGKQGEAGAVGGRILGYIGEEPRNEMRKKRATDSGM